MYGAQKGAEQIPDVAVRLLFSGPVDDSGDVVKEILQKLHEGSGFAALHGARDEDDIEVVEQAESAGKCECTLS